MSLVSRYLDPPLVQRLNHLPLSARSIVAGAVTGLHRSALRGASVEFRQHRAYAPGDEPRRLDWRILGRTDRPYVRQYDQETNLRAMLVLECSGSMAYASDAGSKFDYAARTVAALAYLMLAQTESVGLALAATTIDGWLPPRAGTPQLTRVIECLERAAPAGPSNLAGALHAAATRLPRRALVIVVSDFFEPADALRQGLARLRHGRHEVICLQVLDRDEITFPFGLAAARDNRFAGVPTVLCGLEGEAARWHDLPVLRSRYLANFQRHRRALADACRSLGCELATFVTRQPVGDALVRFLSSRSARR